MSELEDPTKISTRAKDPAPPIVPEKEELEDPTKISINETDGMVAEVRAEPEEEKEGA